MFADRSTDNVTRRRVMVLGLAGLAASSLAACSDSPARQRLPELTYGHLGTFRLDVARIDIVNQYRSPLTARMSTM
jgi:hypothetical protein